MFYQIVFHAFLFYFGVGVGYGTYLYQSNWHDRIHWATRVVGELSEGVEVDRYSHSLVLAFVYSIRILGWPYYVFRGETDQERELKIAYGYYLDGQKERARGIVEQQMEAG